MFDRFRRPRKNSQGPVKTGLVTPAFRVSQMGEEYDRSIRERSVRA